MDKVATTAKTTATVIAVPLILLSHLSLIRVAVASADSVAVGPNGLVDDRQIAVQSLAQIVQKRNDLINFIWGADGFPSTKMPVVETGVVSPFAVGQVDGTTTDGLVNEERVDLLRITMDNIPGDGAEKVAAYHFIPQRKNNRLVVVHQGHDCTMDDRSYVNSVDGGVYAADGMYQLVKSLLADGYSVAAVFMPRYSGYVAGFTALNCPGNSVLNGVVASPHDDMFAVPVVTGSPMKYFLTPTAVVLNYLQSLSPIYTDYSMTGLSGGGWTTTVYPAIDPRIRTSFPVAGSLPLYLRPGGGSAGDTEQILPAFYGIAGYLDLYVMGSYGDGRQEVQILNRRDTCCWGPSWYNGQLPWDTEIRNYEARVRSTVHNLGPGSFSLEVDETSAFHTTSQNAAVNIILTTLNGDTRSVGAASRASAFVRGTNGNIWQVTSTGKTDTGLPMVGAPAVLEGKQHSIDLFYRDATNRLTHAFPNGSGWSTEDLQATISSDPSAVASDGARWDVVAPGLDYHLYHWTWQTGAAVTSELVSGTTRDLGRPTLVSSAGDRLDIVFRGPDETASDLRRNGSGGWVPTSLGGPTMAGFPTATASSDGTTMRVYLRSLADQQLWEGSQATGGAWSWVTVPTNEPLAGSPSAAAAPNQLSVWNRTASGGLAAVSFSNGVWRTTTSGQNLTGSPTSFAAGAWTATSSGDPQAFAAPPPNVTISSVTPDSGSVTGGTQVSISGTQFLAGATVRFGNDPASGVKAVDPATITALAPAHAIGTVDVAVTNADGRTFSSPAAFRYIDFSRATFINPSPSGALDASQPFRWTTIAQAQAYYLTIGSTFNGSDQLNSGTLGPSVSSYPVRTLPGGQHYARIYTQVGGSWSQNYDVTFTTAEPPPDKATFINPSPTTGIDATQPFKWTPVPQAGAYYLTVGSTVGAFDELNSGTLAPSTSSFPVGYLSGGQHYARIYTQIDGYWTRHQDISFAGAGQAAFVNPSPTTGLDTTQPFRWSTFASADAYFFTVGTALGANDEVSSGTLGPTIGSYPMRSLPSGRHYARIYTQVGGYWVRYQDVAFTI